MVFASKSLLEFILVNVRFVTACPAAFLPSLCDSLIIIPQTVYKVNCFAKLFSEIFRFPSFGEFFYPLLTDSLHNISHTGF